MASSNTSTEAQSQSEDKKETLNSPADEKHDLERNSTSISRDTRDSDDAVNIITTDTEKQSYIVQDVASIDDENTVWWDGDDDPENPYNWPTWRKVLNCVLISSLTFITPLASCMLNLSDDDLKDRSS
jgi:hypothetical protein